MSRPLPEYVKPIKLWLVDNYNGDAIETATKIYDNFGVKFTRKQLLGLISNARKHDNLPIPYSNSKCCDKVPEEIRLWLVNNYKGNRKEVAEKIYEIFGYKMSVQKLKTTIHYIRKKNNVPKIENIGNFKKGHICSQKLKVNEIKWACGYYIRVGDKWERRSKLVYEEKFGEIPKDMKIIHINGDIYDDKLENLALVNSKELAFVCGSQLFFDDKRYFETVCQLMKLKRKVAEQNVSS